MVEGWEKNEHGLIEVFHLGEMIARVSDERQACIIYCEACEKTEEKIEAFRQSGAAP